ncbi:unnamed protein product [Oppiella nova]|uniref:Very-long-chain (3R)-3-hydroxyacyl-CoA dehydratase n=1 Tax=Oppiella nova TaxID=334625 RepID=A0A7R9LHW3_9ACAR|nr:unnamed protein product [Oppiella nova]CAG2163777.1 unnamed protein product [Oppiella nova]
MDPSLNDKYLSPFVYWGQTSDQISLKIDLKNVKESSLQFYGSGIGAKGLNEYAFLIQFYTEVNPKESFYKLNDRHIEFVIRKKSHVLWPRLLSSVVRPQWIKVDFDRIQPEDESDIDDNSMDKEFDELVPNQQNSYRNFGQKDFGRRKKSMNKGFKVVRPQWIKVDFDRIQPEDESDIDDNSMDKEFDELVPNQQNSYRNFGQKDFGRRKKSMNKGFKVEDFKKTYLFLYNLFQFVGFVYVFLIVTIRYIKDGSQSTESVYQLVGKVMKFLHLMQILEILHPLMGYTSGSPIMPSIQLSGRVYPYYMLHVFGVNIGFLTWVRYTAWVLLYPLGFISEESRRFSIDLPNDLNFSFHMPTIIRLYLLVGLFPVNHKYNTIGKGETEREREREESEKSWESSVGWDWELELTFGVLFATLEASGDYRTF